MSPAKSKPRVKPRKPGKAVNPSVAEAFEGRLAVRENAVAGNRSTKQRVVESVGESRRGIVKRARKGELDRITAYLPVELGEQVRIYCAGHRVDMSEVIAKALREWIATRGGESAKKLKALDRKAR
jgi:hypothetical protein